MLCCKSDRCGVDGLGLDVKLHICKWSALDPTSEPRLFMTKNLRLKTIQEPEKSMPITLIGWERYQRKSCDDGIKPNERKNAEKLGCKLSLVWFGDGKIVPQDYPLKSP